MAEAAIPATAGLEHTETMLWPQLLRLSITSGHRPLQPQAFHKQRPQAIAATGFPSRFPSTAGPRSPPRA